MSESGIYKKLRSLMLPYFLVFGFLFLIYYYYFPEERRVFLYGISLLATFGTIYFIRILFSAIKIKGIDRTYVVAPDLAILREENVQVQPKVDESACGECGRVIFKPFRCQDCKKYFCGQHYLQGDHKCTDRGDNTIYQASA
jgi:hypothetical protein